MKYVKLLMHTMREHNIDRTEVSYSGSGDSGAVDNVDFFRGDAEVRPQVSALVKRVRDVFNGDGWDTVVEDVPVTIDDLASDAAYEVLDQQVPGYENNDGGSGTVVFTLNSVEVRHEWVVRTYEEFNVKVEVE